MLEENKRKTLIRSDLIRFSGDNQARAREKQKEKQKEVSRLIAAKFVIIVKRFPTSTRSLRSVSIMRPDLPTEKGHFIKKRVPT